MAAADHRVLREHEREPCPLANGLEETSDAAAREHCLDEEELHGSALYREVEYPWHSPEQPFAADEPHDVEFSRLLLSPSEAHRFLSPILRGEAK